MITLLAFALRLALLAVFTFLFVALYEHGPADFSSGVKAEWSALRTFAKREQTPPPGLAEVPPATPAPTPVTEPVATPESTSAPLPSPSATPNPAPPVESAPKPVAAWETLQKQPMGEAMDIPVAGNANDPPPANGSNP